jgi:hypothetical protein
VIVVEMDMHARQDVPLKVMLDMRQFSCQISHMMIVDEGNRRDRITIRIAAPFLAYQLIADEIAQRFRTGGILPTSNDVVEIVKEMVV